MRQFLGHLTTLFEIWRWDSECGTDLPDMEFYCEVILRKSARFPGVSNPSIVIPGLVPEIQTRKRSRAAEPSQFGLLDPLHYTQIEINSSNARTSQTAMSCFRLGFATEYVM
tara:strand:- start:1281 stop:1616 length:336 start_codon:yes stop_codon:yes gene_type:complete